MAEKVGPGVYLDEDRNELHVDVPELLEALGCEDTPATREICALAAKKVVRQVFPAVPVIEG